ncbi:head maturation protease [Mycobacterium phage Indlulamithi]|uniref:Capsid maturation protease n=1 Tax=Mycobacterium phage Indlulamithi TaxID=2656582 RepID=A0A649VD60_9CAUD|nr:head maturation protease [Mycobacterium phage Indlulamithi]QGJ90049.1 hypothetical protein PBI_INDLULAMITHI_8 [Mycobacterium phage Indlulamithi]
MERKFDDRLRSTLSDAAAAIDNSFDKLGDKFSDNVRRAQLSQSKRGVRGIVNELFGATGNLIREHRADAAVAAVDAGLYDQRSILAGIFKDPSDRKAYAESLRLSGRRNIESVITRVIETEKPLSARVYRTAALANGQVNLAINRALARGDSAKQLAESVKTLIDPNVPGGVSYAASRLGRTELNNAFHAQSIHDAQESPWVQSMTWHLSKVHEPQGCICERYAQQGQFPIDGVPEKPHPHCRCYCTPDLPEYDNFEANLIGGQYDSYLNEVLGIPPDDQVNFSAREAISPERKKKLDEILARANAKVEAEKAAKAAASKADEVKFAAYRAEQEAAKKAAAEAKRKAAEEVAAKRALVDDTIPESISKAENAQQVGNLLRHKYNGLTVEGFDGEVDVRSAREIGTAFERQFELVPNTSLRRIVVKDISDSAGNLDTVAAETHTDGENVWIEVNRHFAVNYDEMASNAKQNIVKNPKTKRAYTHGRTAENPWEETFTHEYGHVIDYSSKAFVSNEFNVRRTKDQFGNPIFSPDGKYKIRVPPTYMELFESQSAADEFRTADGSLDPRDVKTYVAYENWFLRHVMSEYSFMPDKVEKGFIHPDEIVAEVYAQSRFGKTNVVTRSIFERLMDTFETQARRRKVTIKKRK